jgi:FdhD protein
MDMIPSPGTVIDLEKMAAARRGTLTTSACGVCGRRSIDDLLARCVALPARSAAVSRADIVAARDALARTQPLFASTGGCHGAALVEAGGAHLATFEDVGRHNAVDKVVGSVRLLARRQALGDGILMVSGRVSFEIVQKAVAAGIGVVAGVSAASSLAIDLAARANVTLAGFVRGESLVVYTGAIAP